MYKLVSIITPVYNRPEKLRQTVASVINQSYHNWEAILVDDGSNQDTIDLLKELSNKDPRIEVVLKPGIKGASQCRNVGLSIAKGEYVMFLDSDDILTTHCLEHRVEYMVCHPELDFAVFPAMVFEKHIGDRKELIAPMKPKANLIDLILYLDIPFNASIQLFFDKRFLLEKEIQWNEELLGFQDIDLSFKCIQNSNSFHFVEQRPESFWRINQGNNIGSRLTSPEYACSHLKLYENIAFNLMKLGEYTDRRKDKVAGVFFSFIKSYLSTGHTDTAKFVIRELFRKNLIRYRRYIEMQLYVSIYILADKLRSNILKRLLNKLYHTFWDHDILYHRRKYFIKEKYVGNLNLS